MVRYLQSSIDEIKQKASIVDVIGADVQLTRGGGGRLKGRCPFHEEKSPSFFVTPADGFYHCFGCGVSGDAFTYLNERQGMTFPEAVAYLGEMLGIDPAVEDGHALPNNSGARKRITDVNDSAYGYFRQALLNGPDARGRDWFTSRQYEPAEAAEKFGAGYAPTTPGLINHMTTLGFTTKDLEDAGLIRKRDRGGFYEVFRGRPLWAIRNGLGRTLGFGARQILADDPLIKAKFINTQETEVYKKEQVLFGLDIAKRNMAKKKQAVVVEGYMDVMSSHLSGIDTAVAACGTSFTAKHVADLARLIGDSGELILMFDADNAGQLAALRAYNTVKDSGIRRVTVVSVSGGKDPDELRKNSGAEAVAHLLDTREPIIRTTIRGTIAGVRAKMEKQGSSWGVEDRVVAADDIIPILLDISDLAIRAEYADFAAAELDLNPADIRARAKVPQRTQARTAASASVADGAPAAATVSERPSDAQLAVQRDAIRLMLRVPDIAQTHRGLVDPANYSHVTGRELSAILWEWQGVGGVHGLMEKLDDKHRNAVIGILASPLPVTFEEADAYAETLQNRLMHDRVERDIAALEAKLATEGSIELLEQLQALRREKSDLRAKSA